MNTRLNSLPDNWRTDTVPISNDPHDILGFCADELEAALPKWVDFDSDNQRTWPQIGQLIAYAVEGHDQPYYGRFSGSSAAKYLKRWRPLCSIDYPPEGV